MLYLFSRNMRWTTYHDARIIISYANIYQIYSIFIYPQAVSYIEFPKYLIHKETRLQQKVVQL